MSDSNSAKIPELSAADTTRAYKKAKFPPLIMLSRRLLRAIPDTNLTRLRMSPFDLFHDPWFNDLKSTLPMVDLKELNDSFVVKADVPGFTKDQIDIDVSGNTLTLKGMKSKQDESSDETWAIKERQETSFQRSIGLPVPIKMSEIKASLKDGVLHLEIPKEQPVSNKIEIE